jgi:hypothetical protein
MSGGTDENHEKPVGTTGQLLITSPEHYCYAIPFGARISDSASREGQLQRWDVSEVTTARTKTHTKKKQVLGRTRAAYLILTDGEAGLENRD